jgi:hypothetical protein
MGRKSWNFIVNEAMLAYLWPSDGRADIYALTPTTGEIRQFTRGWEYWTSLSVIMELCSISVHRILREE